MKKLLFGCFVILVTIGVFSVRQEKVYGITVDNGQEEIIELTQNEKDFFDKMKLKQQYEDEGIMVVDTINGTNKETFNIDCVEYEKDALIYSIYHASKNGELETTMNKHINEMSYSNKVSLYEIQTKANQNVLFYKDFEVLFEDEAFPQDNISIIMDLIPDRLIIDSRDYNLMTNYYYTTVYVGYYEDFNEVSTVTGTYAIQAEYYTNNNEIIYTGSIRYVLLNFEASYTHINTNQFSYQSYYYPVINAPLAQITVIIDYLGKQKMILASDDIGEDFKITRDSHYSRNDYNKINGTPVDLLYPTTTALGSNFGLALLPIASYFHKLLEQNTNNTKYVKETMYYDLQIDELVPGSLELVYDENGDVEYEDLVTFTFNFGVGISDPEIEAVPDAHYVRDVYPYLFWGNSLYDYNSHTPLERFVWDKASNIQDNFVYAIIRSLSGSQLTSQYPTNVGDYGGTPIPSDIINNPYGWSLYFDFIHSQEIHEDNFTNIDWSTFIIHEYSEVPGIITKFEYEDNIDYNNPGTYTVTVGIRDAENHELTQTFQVVVLPKVVIPSC